MSTPKQVKKSNGAVHLAADGLESGAAALGTPSDVACASCAALRSERDAMRVERDAALLELAREREAVNALRLAFPPTTGGPPPPYQPGRGAGAPPPLRYVLVDEANMQIKQYLGPVHTATKRLTSAALRLFTKGKP